jgi:hypothetical protein
MQHEPQTDDDFRGKPDPKLQIRLAQAGKLRIRRDRGPGTVSHDVEHNLGTACPVAKVVKSGRICRHERGEKNKTELAYEEYLQILKLAGEVSAWWFESVTFVLADRATYTPDYVVLYATGVVEIIEIKGFVEDDAAKTFRIARGLFPWLTFKMLKKVKGGWKEVLKAKNP